MHVMKERDNNMRDRRSIGVLCDVIRYIHSTFRYAFYYTCRFNWKPGKGCGGNTYV